jgi:MraZ protein
VIVVSPKTLILSKSVALWGIVGILIASSTWTKLMLFLGEYEHSLDSKQRLAIPSELREVLNPAVNGDSFVAVPGPDEVLTLWPNQTFEKLAMGHGGSLIGDEVLRRFEQEFFSQAARCPLDSAGRVRIPDRLLTRFGLAGAVVILGVRDHLELIASATWKAQQKQRNSSASELWRQANQLMNARSSGTR